MLYKQLSEPETLYQSWKHFKPKIYGFTDKARKKYKTRAESRLQKLSMELQRQEFCFAPLIGMLLPQGMNKNRPLKIPIIRDRIVLKSIVSLIQPTLDQRFDLYNPASFAYLRNRGIKEAIQRMVKLYQSGKRWVLTADIQKFFDTIPTAQLLETRVFPSLSDSSLNALIHSGLHQPIGNWQEFSSQQLLSFPEEGVPQGNPLSPLMANVYLADFDKRMLREGFGLVRYADDFIVMCSSQAEAIEAYRIAQEEIEQKLKLRLYHLDEPDANGVYKTQILHPASAVFSFLSFRFTGTELYPARDKFERFKDKLFLTTHPKVQHNLLNILQKTNQLLLGWLSTYHYCEVDRYFAEIDNYINYRLYKAYQELGFMQFKQEKTKVLSEAQRRETGVLTCAEIFERYMPDRKSKIIRL